MGSFISGDDIEFSSVIISKRSICEKTRAIVVRLNGMKLNFSESDYLKNVFDKEIAHSNCNVILDCQNIDMLFSVQVGIIWSYCRKFRDIGGDLALANLNSSITAVLERFGLLTVIKVGNSVDECIEFIQKK